MDDGIALLGVQAIEQRTRELTAANTARKAENATLKADYERLRDEVAGLRVALDQLLGKR
jgi:hypothetical protein